MAKKVNKGNFNPQDEAIRDKEHINHEALAEAEDFARHSGAPHASPILPSPSNTGNPYISEEDQGMEMVAVVVGPPQYGSPDPTTAASRLLPLDQHPLNVEALPEGHPAAIADDYGEGYGRTLVGGRPSRSDLERHLVGDHMNENNDDVDATEAALELANEKNVSLNDVVGTGADGRVTKDDVQKYLDDQNAS